MHDDGVRVGDRLAQADLLVVDPAERDHRRAHPLGAEARESLRVPALAKRGDREQLCRGDHALAAPAMDANLKHAAIASPPKGYHTGVGTA